MTAPKLHLAVDNRYVDLTEGLLGFSLWFPQGDPIDACVISGDGGSPLFNLHPPKLGEELLVRWFWHHRARYADALITERARRGIKAVETLGRHIRDDGADLNIPEETTSD